MSQPTRWQLNLQTGGHRWAPENPSGPNYMIVQDILEVHFTPSPPQDGVLTLHITSASDNASDVLSPFGKIAKDSTQVREERTWTLCLETATNGTWHFDVSVKNRSGTVIYKSDPKMIVNPGG